MLEPHTIVELREGGEVRAAVVLSETDGTVRLLTANGREVRVPRARIVHATGHPVAASHAGSTSVAEELRQWERDASAQATGVDLDELYRLFAESSDPASALSELSLGDLALLALGRDDARSRAALHRALAAPNPFFRFDGRHWQALPAEEVEREREKLRKAAELAQQRARLLEVARQRLDGARPPWPEGSEKFLRAVRELAIEGEAARSKKEAAAFVAELVAAAQTLTPEAAFALLVRLGVFHADENLALLRAGVREDFPPEVLAEASELVRRPLDLSSRLDLRGLEVVTIDDATTLEVDDGVSFEPIHAGVRIGIHIADAAHFVLPGTLVDEEALARSTSYYLPDRTIPMLPPVIATDAASLVEGADRPSISFLVDVTPHGELIRSEVRDTAVRVTRRLTYEDAEAALDGAGAPSWLPALGTICAALEQQRLAAGASPIRAPETLITFDEAGEPVIHLVDPGRPARRLVSELMILANRIAAEHCRSRGLPAVYRRQAAPVEDVPRPPLDRYDPVAVARFRRVLARTEVSLEPGPHASLGLPVYLQATSPIRRYQDLAVHRVIKASLRGAPPPHSREQLQVIAACTEQAGRQARQVETETDEYWVLRHLERRAGQTLRARVVRVDDRRTFAEVEDYARSFPIAKRPDHVPGKEILLRVRSARPRQGSATFEEVAA
jgi:exoribonuclease-2